MSDAAPFSERLARGLRNLADNPPQTGDAEALDPLRRSIERTLSRIRAGGSPDSAAFRFQLTGGKPVLFMAKEALPLEPARLVPLINAIQLELQPGETFDVDGSLAAWLIRPDATTIESSLRQADITLRSLKAGRDRDHAAAQAAESSKIRLRLKLTQLVTALQFAQKEAEVPLPLTPVPMSPLLPDATPSPVMHTAPASSPPGALSPAPVAAAAPAPTPPALVAVAELSPPPADPAGEAARHNEAIARAVRGIFSAVEGVKFKAVAIGDVGHYAWGSRIPMQKVEVLVPFEGPQRQIILGAANGVGFRPASDDEPLHLEHPDAESGLVIPVILVQAVSSSHRKVVSRAHAGTRFGIRIRVASVEDLILQRIASHEPGHAESVIELFRRNANRFDAAYLKQESEAAGTFQLIRAAWKQSKDPA